MTESEATKYVELINCGSLDETMDMALIDSFGIIYDNSILNCYRKRIMANILKKEIVSTVDEYVPIRVSYL